MADVGLTLVVRACGSIDFSQGGVPSLIVNCGDFAGAPIDNGVGDVSLDFLAGNGVDALACVFVCSPRFAQTPSRLTTIAVEHTSDTRKRFTILQEGAAGAASVLADVPFDFICLSLPGR